MYLWIESILIGVADCSSTEIISSLSAPTEGLFTFLTRMTHGFVTPEKNRSYLGQAKSTYVSTRNQYFFWYKGMTYNGPKLHSAEAPCVSL